MSKRSFGSSHRDLHKATQNAPGNARPGVLNEGPGTQRKKTRTESPPAGTGRQERSIEIEQNGIIHKSNRPYLVGPLFEGSFSGEELSFDAANTGNDTVPIGFLV